MERVPIPVQRWEELAETAHFEARKLAKLCRLSRRQLEREFRRCLGRTPQAWLNERRLVTARQLLLSGLSIKAVAIELGFKQTSHFCRQFKLLNCVTPSQFVQFRNGDGFERRAEIPCDDRG